MAWLSTNWQILTPARHASSSLAALRCTGNSGHYHLFFF
ncbi:hypothetical protein SB359474_1858 [Shigella boydii 3594-74]|nr:hypothetical protein SB359474_1858 [Shigella boydii 3594-74]